jgi:DNA-binding GntR family transcriptional regulator
MPRPIRKSPSTARPAVPPAETFRRSRRDRAAETAQDYVEAIADLTASVGEARVVDLARRLGVTHVTVNRTLARLKKNGFVNTKPYRAIFLTEPGTRWRRNASSGMKRWSLFCARSAFRKRRRKWTRRASSIMSAPKRWLCLNAG